MKRILSILITVLLTAGWCSARSVSGVVSAVGKPLAGVVVTDGGHFAVTDSRGVFRLEVSAKADFVYIVTPAGYTAPFESGTPQFYLPVEKSRKSYDFELLPMPEAGDDYVMITIADPQTQNQRHFDRFRQESIPDLQALVAQYKAQGTNVAGICLGDICWDYESFGLYAEYKAQIATLGIPFYPVIGNHDHNLHVGDDHASAAQYRQEFGPNYYAFQLGKTTYIVLDNIIYHGNKQYEEEISDRQIQWVEDYLQYLPTGSDVVVAMHAPAQKAFQQISPRESVLRLLDRMKGYQVSFISGHTHRNFRQEVIPGVPEVNVASIGGTWWTADYCKDGSPCGYEVFEMKDGQRTWYYKSTGYPRDYQLKLFPRGTQAARPNTILAKVWDWDPTWSVRWSQDGVDQGPMTPIALKDPDYLDYVDRKYVKTGKALPDYKAPVVSPFFFSATPSPAAREVTVTVTDRFGRIYTQSLAVNDLDVEAHRGGRGLMPENTIEAMFNAIDLGVNTLELDMNISKDKQVVVSHDPYMNSKFVTRPDGSEIPAADTKKYKLYQMIYDSIRTYDTGLKPYADFPQQRKIRTYKPLVSELIDSVENYAARRGCGPMFYNIEIKSSASRDGIYSPEYREFTDLAMAVLLSKGLGDRLLVQCFDTRTLKYLHERYPQVRLSYLVDAKSPDLAANLEGLGFVPEVYSPEFHMVTPEMLQQAHERGMRVVVWTPNEEADIQKMIELGVDGIISDYPDRVLKLTRK